MSELRIGISGWTYPPWRGTFYPKGLVQKRELEYAAKQVNSIEINGSFYSLQTPASYRAWHDCTPEDFVFAVKAPRYISHLKRLRGVETPLANFFASGVLRLGPKLGPILWQLPPMFPYDEKRLEAFFRLLPRDTEEAAALAKKHDDKVAGRSWTRMVASKPLRYALEVRHPSFEQRDFVELLRAHDVALVVADTAGKWPFMEDVTSDLVYVRLHGDEQLYVSGYTDEALNEWTRKIRAWMRGQTPAGARLHAPLARQRGSDCDIHVYFDNDVKVRAPYDAMTLANKLGFGPVPGVPPDPKQVTEVPRPIAADSRWQFGRAAARRRGSRAARPTAARPAVSSDGSSRKTTTGPVRPKRKKHGRRRAVSTGR